MNESPFGDNDTPTMKEFMELKGLAVSSAELLSRVVSATARMEGDIFELKRDVSELKGLHVKFDRFQTTLDGMSRQMESFDRWVRFQGSMLVEHEGRLAKLEQKPS